jgi:hypothetical protein
METAGHEKHLVLKAKQPSAPAKMASNCCYSIMRLSAAQKRSFSYQFMLRSALQQKDEP